MEINTFVAVMVINIIIHHQGCYWIDLLVLSRKNERRNASWSYYFSAITHSARVMIRC